MMITCVTAPILAAFLASAQQIAGGAILIPAVILLLSANFIVFGFTQVVLNPMAGVDQLERARVNQARLQAVFILGAAGCVYYYVLRENDKLAEYAKVEELLSPTALVIAIIDRYGTSSRIHKSILHEQLCVRG